MSLAVITTVSGRHDHLRLQLAGLRASARRPDVHVVVSMDDPEIADICGDAVMLSMPRQNGRLPVAAARNAGAAQAAELGAEVLVFLDVDCVPDAALFGRYDAVVRQHPDALISGPVGYLPPAPEGGYLLDELPTLAPAHPARPAPAPEAVRPLDHRLFWSLSFAVRTATFTRIGGFYTGYTGYGGEDTDFAELARGLGVPHLLAGGAWAYHQWHAAPDPPLGHLHDILRNGRVFRDRWGWWPMEGWLAEFKRMGLVKHDPVCDDWVLSAPGCDVPETAGPR